MRPYPGFALATFILGAIHCGGANVRIPTVPFSSSTQSAELESAVEEEARGDASRATEKYLSLLKTAATSSEGADAAPFVLATIDALVTRRIQGLDRISSHAGLAFRSNFPVEKRLEEIERAASGPFSRGLLADALLTLAMDAGDIDAARKWRRASGCALEGALYGPVSSRPLIGFSEAPAPDGGPLPANRTLDGPFSRSVALLPIGGTGCALNLTASSAVRGLRDVAFDIDVDDSGPFGVVLDTNVPARVYAGGKVLLERSTDLGPRSTRVLGAFTAKSTGRARIWLRAMVDLPTNTVSLRIWNSRGEPVVARAPKPGDRADSTVVVSEALHLSTRDRPLVSALAELALGWDRRVEQELEDVQPIPMRSSRAPAAPSILLARARAQFTAEDISPAVRSERVHSTIDSILKLWPDSWEGRLFDALVAGERKGGEARDLEVLGKLETGRQGLKDSSMLDVLDALLSRHERLYQRAKMAKDRAQALHATRIFEALAQRSDPLTAEERIGKVCSGRTGRDSFDCQVALRDAGKRPEAAKELARLRALYDGPNLFRPLELFQALADRDLNRARQIFSVMPIGERTLGGLSATAATPVTREQALALAPFVLDAPQALSGTIGALGAQGGARADDPSEIRKKLSQVPAAGNEATVVVDHSERFVLSKGGVLLFQLYDLRRVGGTTDVEEHAQTDLPHIEGTIAAKVLRRRIFKADGRLVEPDRTPHAQQSHADLAQLERGDAVEAVYEGWAIPDGSGHLGFDSADLLPERTSVQHAHISVALPRDLRYALRAHPLLNAIPAVETTRAASPSSSKTALETPVPEAKRVWRLENAPVRRVETDSPAADRNVSVSFSTLAWKDVGSDLSEHLALLEGNESSVGQWVQDVLPHPEGLSPREKLQRIVAASGTAIRDTSSSDLLGAVATSTQNSTIRTYLTSRTGSRAYLIWRALRFMGFPAQIALVEEQPSSSDPTYPPHRDRFERPLVVALDPPIWIDPDVAGPPLPAGHLSPQLRGRMALFADGHTERVPTPAEGQLRDDVSIELDVDRTGSAVGDVSILLRGRAAQILANNFERVVGTDREMALREVVLGFVPLADVEKIELSSREGSWEIQVHAKIRMGAFARRGRDGRWSIAGVDPLHSLFPRGRSSTMSSSFASHGERTTPLSVTSGASYRLRRKMRFPDGTKFEELPSRANVDEPLVPSASSRLRALRTVTVRGNSLEDEYSLDIPTGTVSPTEYPAFLALARSIDAAFLRRTIANW